MKFFRAFALAIFFFSSSRSIAQIGINTITPDSSASLHILSKPGGSGLIIPELTEAQRLAIPKPAVGLMVYDLSAKLFYVNMETATGNNWYAINPWLTQGSSSTPNVLITSPVVTKVGIGIQSPQVPQATLDVNGDIKASTAVATPTLNVTGFATNALVPTGGIMMWSGDPANIPLGWALCDGKTYGTLTTPDLRGRFIVGYDAGDADYNYSGNKYGPAFADADGTYTGSSTQEAKKVKLSALQSGVLPHTHTTAPHNHTIPGIRWSDSNGFQDNKGSGTGTTGSYTPSTEYQTVTVNVAPAAPALEEHENRPPYYVLAYIIKIP